MKTKILDSTKEFKSGYNQGRRELADKIKEIVPSHESEIYILENQILDLLKAELKESK